MRPASRSACARASITEAVGNAGRPQDAIRQRSEHALGRTPVFRGIVDIGHDAWTRQHQAATWPEVVDIDRRNRTAGLTDARHRPNGLTQPSVLWKVVPPMPS